jgi:hypothetical protein
MSCQEIEPGTTWLLFVNTEHAFRFVARASKALDFFVRQHNMGFGTDADDDFGAVSIRFPARNLKALTRLVPGKKARA